MENIESTFVPKALVLMYIPLGLITFHISFFSVNGRLTLLGW